MKKSDFGLGEIALGDLGKQLPRGYTAGNFVAARLDRCRLAHDAPEQGEFPGRHVDTGLLDLSRRAAQAAARLDGKIDLLGREVHRA